MVLLDSNRTLDLWYSEICTNIRSRAFLIFCDPSQRGAILYFATRFNGVLYCISFKMASMTLWYSVKSAPTYGAEQSWSFATRLNGVLYCILRPVSTGHYTIFALKWPLWPSYTQWNLHQHMEPSSLDLLRPVSMGRYTVFCDPSQRAAIQYLLLKWHWAFATHLYICCDPQIALWPSDIFCAWGFPLDASHRQLYLLHFSVCFYAYRKPQPLLSFQAQV